MLLLEQLILGVGRLEKSFTCIVGLADYGCGVSDKYLNAYGRLSRFLVLGEWKHLSLAQ